MPQYLVAVLHPANYDGSKESESMMRDISALNDEMERAGVRLFAGGLQPPAKARSVQQQPDGLIAVTDGPHLEATEHIGGFWLLRCADMDEAVTWARKATVACRVPIEVREFLQGPQRGTKAEQTA